MITVRYGAQPNQQLYFAIESPFDGMWFDWKTGTFQSKPTAELQPFNQDNYVPGRYTIDFAQQVAQFPNGKDLMFWIVTNTGMNNPIRQVMDSYTTQVAANPPWAYHIYSFYVCIREP